MLNLPFDPVKRSEEIEMIVTKGLRRKYYRFRAAGYYGGIATADAVGCCFLCAYCWNYFRNLKPQHLGQFFSPQEVAENLLRIIEKKGFRYCRITGCEPILGSNSLAHLIQVINMVLDKDKDLTFIVETNGFILGYYPQFILKLKIPRLTIRFALKGWDEESFEMITGVDKRYFIYPMRGLKKCLELNLDAWPAIMQDIFGDDNLEKLKQRLIGMGINSEIESEELERYPYVLENIKERKIMLKY
ncbi:MAG: radical SAM protein [Candidatus Omnitrophica bacterium]|nr:radical SAM protein [Candidatus Omnitrophota bacterium]